MLVVPEDADGDVPGASAPSNLLHVIAEGQQEGVDRGGVRHVLAITEHVLAGVDELHEVAAVRYLTEVELGPADRSGEGEGGLDGENNFKFSS